MKCEFGLRHRSFEAEQEAVVEVGGVIEPVLVTEEGASQCAVLQQAVPVGVVASQTGDLQAEHDPGPTQADLGHEMLEALLVGGGGARGPGRSR